MDKIEILKILFNLEEKELGSYIGLKKELLVVPPVIICYLHTSSRYPLIFQEYYYIRKEKSNMMKK